MTSKAEQDFSHIPEGEDRAAAANAARLEALKKDAEAKPKAPKPKEPPK